MTDTARALAYDFLRLPYTRRIQIIRTLELVRGDIATDGAEAAREAFQVAREEGKLAALREEIDSHIAEVSGLDPFPTPKEPESVTTANIYVASSWRNPLQPAVIGAIRASGLACYDFRHPAPDDNGFHWSEIDPDWQGWSPQRFADALEHPIARDGFAKDKAALDEATHGLLVMPCGRSAHLELGYLAGRGLPTAILLADGEPELMYGLASRVLVDWPALLDWLEELGAPVLTE